MSGLSNGMSNGHGEQDEPFMPYPGYATAAIHAGQEPEQWKSMAVIPPISLSTTFKQAAPGQHAGFEYSRSGNPTRNVAEACIAALDGGKHGMLFSSGLGATMTLTHLLNAGDHVIAMNDLYGGTNRYFRKCASKQNIETSFIDMTNVDNVTAAIRPNTKMVWLETPTNPLLQVVDVEAVCAAVHRQPGIFVVVDSTFATSYFQRPLELGADVVMHSCTKYMNGHGDVVMGALITSDDSLAERLRFLQNAIGPVPSPFDCYLLNRGMKTLPVRMQQHQRSGLEVARWLESDSRVEKVLHPGLPSHPQHDVAKRQMRGFSGMITFYLRGGLDESSRFLSALQLFTLAESLGGFESLAEHPAIMTHASIAREERESLGITDNLCRLSVGLEDVEDLIQDLDKALTAACGKQRSA